MDMNDVLWRKSSRSKEDGSNCVELASTSENIVIRDSKDPDGSKLILACSDFKRFANAVKHL